MVYSYRAKFFALTLISLSFITQNVVAQESTLVKKSALAFQLNCLKKKSLRNDRLSIETHNADANKRMADVKLRKRAGGISGAAVGFWIGWTITNVVGHGVIFLGCRAIDLVAPGAGATAEVGLHAAAAPVIAGTAKVISLGTGLLGAILTGPA